MTKALGLLVGSTALIALAAACTPVEDVASSAHAVTPPEKSIYVAICGFSIASYDPNLSFRFYVEASRASSSLDLQLSPLVGWDEDAGQPSPPAVVSHGGIVGDPLHATAPITRGRFEAALGDFEVPPLANGITGGPAHVDHLRLDGPAPPRLGARFCAGFAGQLTKPLELEFLRDENTCLFIPIADGDPMPVVEAGDFHCR